MPERDRAFFWGHITAYCGIDPEGALFLVGEGLPYKLIQRKTTTWAISYSCDSLSQLFRKMRLQAGIEGPSAMSGRRTFAIFLSQEVYDLRHINKLVGHETLAAPKRPIDADLVRLDALVAGVIWRLQGLHIVSESLSYELTKLVLNPEKFVPISKEIFDKITLGRGYLMQRLFIEEKFNFVVENLAASEAAARQARKLCAARSRMSVVFPADGLQVPIPGHRPPSR